MPSKFNIDENLKNFLTHPDDDIIPVRRRQILIWLISLIATLSVLGNIASFSVNIKRKMRPFYRTCLLSLAFSDLLTTVSSTIPFIAQLSTLSTEIWVLGELLCDGIPFAYAVSMLINSLTLVSITIARYMAVKKVIMNILWDPGICFCVTYIIFNYSLAIVLSSPIFTTFHIELTTLVMRNPLNHTEILEEITIQICTAEGSNDEDTNTLFFFAVYLIIIVPIIIIFFLLNCIIAQEMWKRSKSFHKLTAFRRDYRDSKKIERFKNSNPVICKKHQIINDTIGLRSDSIISRSESQTIYHSNQKFIEKEMKKSIETCYVKTKYLNKTLNKNRKSAPRNRYKLFMIIIFLMIVFLVCRFPRSLFIVLYLESGRMTVNEWTLHYSLEILSLISCVLNPLFYTFMPETLKFCANLTDAITKGLITVKRKLCIFNFKKRLRCKSKKDTVELDNNTDTDNNFNCKCRRIQLYTILEEY